MSNALGRLAPPTPDEIREDPAPSPSDVALLLRDVSQDDANQLMRAFDEEAFKLEARNPTAMWALAMLWAKILASAEIGDEQTWAAARFGEMLQLALPAMMLAVEKAKRLSQGRPSHDS